MVNLRITHDELTFIHHIIGHVPSSEIINFALTKITDVQALKDLESIKLNNKFICHLYDAVDSTYKQEMELLIYNTKLKQWRDDVANGKTLLSFDDYVKDVLTPTK